MCMDLEYNLQQKHLHLPKIEHSVAPICILAVTEKCDDSQQWNVNYLWLRESRRGKIE